MFGAGGLTDEVVGPTQIVVPHRHLQGLLGQVRQRDVIKELLQKNIKGLQVGSLHRTARFYRTDGTGDQNLQQQLVNLPTSLNSGFRVFFITDVLCLDFFWESGFRYLRATIRRVERNRKQEVALSLKRLQDDDFLHINPEHLICCQSNVSVFLSDRDTFRLYEGPDQNLTGLVWLRR